jgi:hypothetical protein
VVHLRGAISGGTDNTVAFVLPKPLRPSHLIFPVTVGSGPTVANLEIKPDGDVLPFGSDVTDFTGLDGVSFVAGE